MAKKTKTQPKARKAITSNNLALIYQNSFKHLK